jgi:hypothetical protein
VPYTTLPSTLVASQLISAMAEAYKKSTLNEDATPRAAKRRHITIEEDASSNAANNTETANTEPHVAALHTYDLGDGVTRTDTGKDPSNIVGKTTYVPNRLWGARLTGVTQCNVSGFIGPYKFGRSGQKPAYVIQAMDDNLFYPIAADYIEHLVQMLIPEAHGC